MTDAAKCRKNWTFQHKVFWLYPVTRPPETKLCLQPAKTSLLVYFLHASETCHNPLMSLWALAIVGEHPQRCCSEIKVRPLLERFHQLPSILWGWLERSTVQPGRLNGIGFVQADPEQA